MDSRRCSAALGFALLIGCVIGIVILIHNSGSSRKSSESSSSSSSSVEQNYQHRSRASPTTVVGGKATASNAGDHFVSSPKGGFANDPNYRSSQPTMQEVNELADELHRLLSSKSKHVHGSSGNGKGNPVNSGTVTSVKKTNGSMTSTSSSATSSAKASITAINYSSVPKKGSLGPPGGSVGSMTAAPALPTPVTSFSSTNSSLTHRSHPPTLATVKRQEMLANHHQRNHHNQKPYPGHQSPPSFSPSLSPNSAHNVVDSVERLALAPHEKKGRGGGVGGLAHNDLYTTSWHPSIASPSGGSMAAPNHPYHHLRNHPESHHPHNNNAQPPRPASPAKINKTGKGTGYPLNQNHNRAPNPKQYQQGYHHYRHDHEKEERFQEEEDGDFVEVDDDDEDDVSGNLGNVKKEEEWDDDNDIADDDNEEVEEEDEEEEDEEDNGANPGFLIQPKNLAADLETLFSLANHLYTSPASLLSAFSSTQAKSNSTKNRDTSTSTSGFPTAFQGFLKVINETIQRSNSSKLLVELNEKYQGREARMSKASNNRNNSTNTGNNSNANQTSNAGTASSTSNIMKNGGEDNQQSPYEKSLTSFVFMSFGVFLLNQIHSFVQKTAEEHLKRHKFMSNDTVAGEARALSWEEDGPFTWYSPRSEMMMTTESSSLDILFQNPVSLNDSSTVSESPASGRSNDQDTFDDSISGEGHVNNMFRALLNIANAYTKDSPAVECIWSLYCQDLDQTAYKSGLYGVAARINSVGLRLIMKQIPPALTFDVILRSLVGWDGLPCRKMFPDCTVGNGTISMASAEEDDVVVKKMATNTL